MKLQYVAVLIFLNSEATQYLPLPKPIVVKVEVKKVIEQPQNEQVLPSCRSYDSEQPQAMIMEKTEENEETGLRNRRKKSHFEPKPQEISKVRSQQINRTHSLGLFSLFSCSNQIGE
ncbi:hypothetical protein HYX58_04060 [Candidatus Dependentiae bacterium]|nr:hypothetical protein [Candidatus Dependentiae bacterium]